MSGTQARSEPAIGTPRAPTVDMKLEVVVIPVADVERAAEFYGRLGWRKDADVAHGNRRLLQFTPPGSACSIIFGTGVTRTAPGTAQFIHLVVSDIDAARAELIARGVEASEVFHDAGGGYNRFDPSVRATGPDPERRSYASFLTFSDPDGNSWLLQEITTRLPGRIGAKATQFTSAADLAGAMRRAATAHGAHEKRLGAADPNWPDWYAAYIVAEQIGEDLPS